jgi:hypothetical protein
VQIAIENIVCCTVAENFHQFSPENLKALVDGFDAAPPRGTMAACIPAEKTSFLDWLAGRIIDLQKENPGNDAKVMTAVRELVASMEGPAEDQASQRQSHLWEDVNRAAGGTSDGVIKLVRDEGQLYERLATVLALPQPEYEGQAKEFSAEIQKSQNPLVALSFPAFQKARQKEFAIQAELAMVRAAVEYKLRGEPGRQSVADPGGEGRPLDFQRFVFEGVDRGFELKSAYDGRGFREVLIFVEKEGLPFQVNGKNAGQAAVKTPSGK